jgi:entericidin B
MAKKIAVLLSLVGFAVAAVSIAGCNTVEGVGKDVKATGQAIEKAADKNKGY